MIQKVPQTFMDCEIIYHLYATYGIEKTLKLLDGVFVFALFDTNLYNHDASFTQKLYVARDAMGVRPLYQMTKRIQNMYSKNNQKEVIGFSSNMDIFKGMFVKEDCDIEPFLPGTFSKYEISFKTFSIWKNTFQNKYFYIPCPTFLHCFHYYMDNINWYIDGIHIHLQESVRKRMTYAIKKNRNMGCILSGGVKSGLIASIIMKQFAEMNINHLLNTFAIGLEGSTDLLMAKKTAEYLGTNHYEIIITRDDVFDAIPDVINALETHDKKTVRDGIGNFLIGKWIRENTNVYYVFNGDGGDAICSGYKYMSELNELIEFEIETRIQIEKNHVSEMVRSDKSMSCHGLKSISPFLDMFFVNFYLSIPLHIRCQNLLNKGCLHLLRKAFSIDYCEEDWLPNSVLNREKTSDYWIGNSEWFSELIEEKTNREPYLALFQGENDLDLDKEDKLYRFYFMHLLEK
jgi:asparagine synthase (glutamine-hydrolysing)